MSADPDYYRTPHWWRIRREQLRFQDYYCADCGCSLKYKGARANVHHLHYKSIGNEEIGKDVVALCRECHNARHFIPYMKYVPALIYEERDYSTFIHSS